MAKRPITDIEYQILDDAITQCDSSNIDGATGIKVPVGDRDVPIGGAKMRVKAIGGNPPSAWLSNTVAFTASGIEPNLVIDDVPNVSVGDDIYTSYSSDSDGIIAFSSSDASKGTVVDMGGYLKITGVATGSFNVIANQAADGSFSGKIVNEPVTTVTKTIDNTTVYADYPTGLAAVSNGQEFAINNTEGSTKRVYLKSSGEGIYQRTVPVASYNDIDTVHKAIDSEFFGEMPLTPLVDIDSTYSFYHRSKLKTVGDTGVLDNNILNYPILDGVTEQGAFTIVRDGNYGGKVRGYDVTFPANTGSSFSPVTFLMPHSFLIPEGQWTVQMDIKTGIGQADVTLYYANVFFDTPNYKPHLVTNTFTTIIFDKVHYSTPTPSDYYPFIISTGNLGSANTTPSVNVIIENIRMVPGTALQTLATSSVKTLSTYDEKDLISNANNGLLFDFSKLATDLGVTSSLISKIYETTNSLEATLIISFKTTDNGGYMYSIPDDATNYFGGELINGEVKSDLLFNNIAQNGTLLNGGDYNILAITRDQTEAKIFINGNLVAYKLNSTGNIILRGLQFFGIEKVDAVALLATMSGVSFWGSKLTDGQIEAATEIANKRLLAKGEYIEKQNVFYIAEGDSITWMPNSYQYLVRKEYSPFLQGSCPAESGAFLGTSADVLPTNTIYARKDWVIGMAQSQIDKGVDVVMTVDIGSNDLFTLLTSSPNVTAWYAKWVAYIADFRAIGVKVIGCTIMDVEAISDKTYLNQANALIRGDATAYDGLADFNASSLLTPTTPTYFTDGQHPTDAGFEVMTDILKPVIDDLI